MWQCEMGSVGSGQACLDGSCANLYIGGQPSNFGRSSIWLLIIRWLHQMCALGWKSISLNNMGKVLRICWWWFGMLIKGVRHAAHDNLVQSGELLTLKHLSSPLTTLISLVLKSTVAMKGALWYRLQPLQWQYCCDTGCPFARSCTLPAAWSIIADSKSRSKQITK